MAGDPTLADPVPDEMLSGGVTTAPAPEAGELDGGEAGVEELALDDAEAVADALAVLVAGDAVPAGQGFGVVRAAFLLLVTLGLAFAEAVVLVPLAPLVALALAVAVAVVLALALALLPDGLVLGLSLALPLGGLLTGLAGVTLGVTDLVGLADLAAAGDDDLGGHEVVVPLLGLAEVRPGLVPPPPDEPAGLPDPARLGTPLVLEEEIPTAEPSWANAARSGGTARATPMANTAQATARAGRSSPYRQSRGVSWPPRSAFHRRTRPARKPSRAVVPGAAACLLAWAWPAPTRARIRSSPSGRGST